MAEAKDRVQMLDVKNIISYDIYSEDTFFLCQVLIFSPSVRFPRSVVLVNVRT